MSDTQLIVASVWRSTQTKRVTTGGGLNARFSAALLVAVCGSQLWRALAENVRADYAGRERLAPYQRVPFATAALGAAAAWLIPLHPATTDLTVGLASLCNPPPLLTLELLWLAAFFAMGRRTQTGSSLGFGVHPGRI